MAASYKKLFKLLIDRDMKKKELAETDKLNKKMSSEKLSKAF
jgi:DNA-binding Xre family transcriptional regulator